jgi:hypothetical protein
MCPNFEAVAVKTMEESNRLVEQKSEHKTGLYMCDHFIYNKGGTAKQWGRSGKWDWNN